MYVRACVCKCVCVVTAVCLCRTCVCVCVCRRCCRRYIGVTEADYEWLTDQIVQVANR
jgi:hypothetical protein